MHQNALHSEPSLKSRSQKLACPQLEKLRAAKLSSPQPASWGSWAQSVVCADGLTRGIVMARDSWGERTWSITTSSRYTFITFLPLLVLVIQSFRRACIPSCRVIFKRRDDLGSARRSAGPAVSREVAQALSLSRKLPIALELDRTTSGRSLNAAEDTQLSCRPMTSEGAAKEEVARHLTTLRSIVLQRLNPLAKSRISLLPRKPQEPVFHPNCSWSVSNKGWDI
jgi:hypothetical protein